MKLRVYYLDDEPELLSTFSDIFSSENVSITTFESTDEAVAAIKLNPPDLLFLDYRLPGTTGDQVALSIDSSIPKALVTGDLRVELKSQFEELFAKPYQTEKIKTFIGKFLYSSTK